MFSSVQFCDINFKSATKPKPCVRPRCTKFEVDITNIGQAQGQVCVCVCVCVMVKRIWLPGLTLSC